MGADEGIGDKITIGVGRAVECGIRGITERDFYPIGEAVFIGVEEEVEVARWALFTLEASLTLNSLFTLRALFTTESFGLFGGEGLGQITLEGRVIGQLGCDFGGICCATTIRTFDGLTNPLTLGVDDLALTDADGRGVDVIT